MLTFDQVALAPGSGSMRRVLLEDGSIREALALELWRGSPHDATPFGSLLCGLEQLPHPPPWQRGLGVRASNALRTAKLGSWADLAACSPAHLRKRPNLGTKTFVEIVEMLLIAWAQEDHPLGISSTQTGDDTPASTWPAPATVRAIADDEAEALADVLRWLWVHRGVSSFGEALANFPFQTVGDIPPELRASVERLASSELVEALSLKRFQTEDWAWLLDFDDRGIQILEHRVFAERPLTLDQLSIRFGVTRERIRQIESRLIEELDVRLTAGQAQGLHHLASRLRREAKGLMTPDRFGQLVDGLVLESGASQDRLTLCSAILARTAGEWLTWQGDIAGGELVRLVRSTIEQWRSAGPSRPIPAAELDVLLARLESSQPNEQLFEALGIRRINGVTVWWGRTHGDRGVAVLTAYDRVARFGEMHSAIGSSLSPRSLQNALLHDERIMRRGKDTYGLRTWGGEEYTGLYDELEQAIERAGGRVPLAQLVERFVDDFGVTAGSVLAYAADRRFVKHEDGTLAMRTAADPEVRYSHIPIEQTAGTYRLDGVWHACFEIDDDLARGSGRFIRRGIAQAAGLEPDLTFAVIYDAGTVIFTWGGNQPAVGSIRELLSHHGCSLGDLLLLPLSGVEPRCSRVPRLSERERWGGVARVAAEMGLAPSEVEEEEQPVEVADAVGLPPGADWHDIADRLRDRKETRIVALLPEYLR